uniref:PilX N-terminal domain-containing pilus assembly protein n=1 Tax=Candidatus Electronema sp. TaxID=2698783 RepID=UPI0040570268
MRNENKAKRNEDGFVMIASLLILLVLTLLGIAVNQNSETEWRIAMNDRLQKETFYQADAASELAAEALEQSIACLGFQENSKDVNGHSVMKILGSPFGAKLLSNGKTYSPNDLVVLKESLGFWRKYAEGGVGVPILDEAHKDYKDPDMVFQVVLANGSFDFEETKKYPHARINIGGNTKIASGSAIQMAAGYEGLGQGISSGGAALVYSINVRQVDPVNGGDATVCVQYGHIMGTAGFCNSNL